MAFQRGTYGIEFDGQPGAPFRKLWIPVVLVLVVVLPLLVFRSCGGRTERDAVADEDLGQTRYRMPEVEAKRERPSLWRHFLNFGFRGQADPEERVPQTAGMTGHGNRWLDADIASKPETKVQSPDVQRLLEQVVQLETADDLVNARLVLHQILLRKDAEDVRAFVERKIGAVNTALVFGDRLMPEKERHRIVSGDLIGKLAQRYGNTQAYVLRVNGIDRADRLRIGREIWVLNQPVFELTVFKKASSAVLTLNGQFFKRYEVGAGPSVDVPVGTYVVRDGILARLGLRGADAEELRVLLSVAVAVVVGE